MFGRIYQALGISGFFFFIVPKRMKPRLIRFKLRQGSTVKILMGQRVVGEYDARTETWKIDRPYRIFVNENLIRKGSLQNSDRNS